MADRPLEAQRTQISRTHPKSQPAT